jgi:histidyl-tRNA synthetase
MSKLQPVRGTRDILGKDIPYFNMVINIAKVFASLYKYDEIVTPIFEFSDIFLRTLGEASDIVSKETYTFSDRDKTSITLRPEFTAGIVRALISNGLTQTLPQKLFTYGPLFRHERPQKARYRQFHQINFEFIGAKDPYSDVETIQLACDILKELGLSQEVKLELNTLGDSTSRQNYKAKLIEYFSRYQADLSPDSQIRLDKNPLRILDSKDEGDKKIILNAPKGHEYLTPQARAYFDKILEGLEYLGIPYSLNEKLVRGLDYYTHTVFEFTTNRLGSQGTVLAGGRYDGLVETMGGPSVPAIGFAAGIERLAELMLELSGEAAENQVFSLIPIGEEAEKYALKLAHDLRKSGFPIDFDFASNVGKRMKRANKIKAHLCLLFGDEELAAKQVKVKDMLTGEESICALDDLVARLRK